MKKVGDYFPRSTHELFDDASALELITRLRGRNAAKAYRSCAHPAMRADLFRYVILAEYGGIYFDADDFPVKPMDELISGHDEALAVRKWHGFISNNFIACRKQSNALEHAAQSALFNVSTRSSFNIWEATGPHVLHTSMLHAGLRPENMIPFAIFRDHVHSVSVADANGPRKHWRTFQQRNSIYHGKGNKGLFDIIEELDLPLGADAQTYLFTGLRDRNKILRAMETQGIYPVAIKSVTELEARNDRILRWFFPFSKTLPISYSSTNSLDKQLSKLGIHRMRFLKNQPPHSLTFTRASGKELADHFLAWLEKSLPCSFFAALNTDGNEHLYTQLDNHRKAATVAYTSVSNPTVVLLKKGTNSGVEDR